ncbi:MAG: AarF/ABC1/UbiB kinase family protein [Pseudomonadales bacterium]|nr:AarF/ABC1/UbiB kinase family protein [Pseudomonadales bacterium]
MLKEMLLSIRSAKRIGQTSLAANKLVLRWLINRKSGEDQLPILLRDTMQDLGATYIKLGQLVASSPTLFPQEYVDAFQSCLDQTTPLPFSTIQPILEEQLGAKLKTQFKFIDEKPLASASIAQVHAAQLITGEHVVLKVQKPGVKELLETDFHFLQVATQLIDLINPKAWKSSIIDIVEEIRNGMLEECDFLQEADNIEEFRDFLSQANIDHVVVPEVYRKLSTKKVLVMERFYGVPLADLDGVRDICGDPEFALLQALDAWFMSLRQCQHYHADLHAGNVMMLNDGRIGFIDFGIVGRLSTSTWEGITSLAVCVPNEDFDGLALALTKIGATKDEVDLKVFANDLEAFWSQVSNDNTSTSEDPDSIWRAMMVTFSTISARHGIRFPREFTLLIKQFLYFDRYIRVLAPDVDMFDADRLDMMQLAG